MRCASLAPPVGVRTGPAWQHQCVLPAGHAGLHEAEPVFDMDFGGELPPLQWSGCRVSEREFVDERVSDSGAGVPGDSGSARTGQPVNVQDLVAHHVGQIRDALTLLEPGRVKSCVLTKLDEAELWLTRLPHAATTEVYGDGEDGSS